MKEPSIWEISVQTFIVLLGRPFIQTWASFEANQWNPHVQTVGSGKVQSTDLEADQSEIAYYVSHRIECFYLYVYQCPYKLALVCVGWNLSTDIDQCLLNAVKSEFQPTFQTVVLPARASECWLSKLHQHLFPLVEFLFFVLTIGFLKPHRYKKHCFKSWRGLRAVNQ